MRRVVMVLFLCIGMSCCFSGSLFAQNLQEDGFDIDIMWKVTKSRFKIWGDIEKGQACNKIRMSAYFENEKTKKQKTVRTVIRGSHSPNGRSSFVEEDNNYYDKYRNSWVLYDLSISCYD